MPTSSRRPSGLRSQAGSRPSSAASGSLSTSSRGSGASSACQGTAISGSSRAKRSSRVTAGVGARLTPSRVRRSTTTVLDRGAAPHPANPQPRHSSRRGTAPRLAVEATDQPADPVRAPNPAPTYEGRPLPRPDDEVVDQGLGFDVGTLLSRRRMLRAARPRRRRRRPGRVRGRLGDRVVDAAPTGASASAAATGEIPDETAGPYPGDGSNGPDVLEQSGIVRSDIRSSFGGATGTAEGVPMTLELTITDLASGGAPFAGVAVYVWHCDREGGYSMYSAGVEDQNYLRGVQVADAAASCASPASSRPATAGGGRTSTSRSTRTRRASPTSRNAIATSQVALPAGRLRAGLRTARATRRRSATSSQVSLRQRQRLRRRRRRAASWHRDRRRRPAGTPSRSRSASTPPRPRPAGMSGGPGGRGGPPPSAPTS